MIYCDIHTHQLPRHPADKAIVTVTPGQSALNPSACYAAGIHPWNAGAESLTALYEQARLPNVVAIGETGLDKRNSPPLAVQEECFVAHIKLAEATGRPLIIHCVGAWDELIRLRKTSAAPIRWIVHGFRGNGTLARQLLKAGFDLSFGRRFNPAAAAEAWAAHRLFAETDDEDIDIRGVYEALAASLAVAQEDLSQQIAANFEETIRRR
jgi:TatD DNase family protein